MSNTNSPFGFRWWGPKSGGGTYSLIPHKIQATYATALYRGDLVKYASNSATGYAVQAAAGGAAANVYNIGIFYGVEYLSTSQGRRVFSTYWSAGGAGTDHPTTANGGDGDALIIPLVGAGGASLFQVQLGNSSSVYAVQADIGKNVYIYVGTGSVVGGNAVSGMTIDATSIATGAGSSGVTGLNYPFRIYDLLSNYAPSGTNGTDNTSAYNQVIVEVNPNIVATAGLY